MLSMTSELGEPVRLSVALVTRGRPARLGEALASLRGQGVQPWEIVISDDSDPLEASANQLLAEHHGCRYISGPKKGLYANRNAAALACRGTHIRTMDDDHELPPGHLAACLEAVAADPDAIWVIGEWIPAWGNLPSSVPGPGEVHPRGFTVQPRDPQRSAAIADGSTIFPRSAFGPAGARYLENFTFGMVYLELGDRLAHLGFRIRRLDSTHVIHHATPSSIDDRETTDAARVFAMLSHSFLYKPTFRNRLLTTLEILRLLATPRGSAARSVRRGFVAFRERRAQ
jgi:glycosyltransferase involved in cell wall biosynthesis